MEKENRWSRWSAWAFFGCIFFALLAFFTEAHMLVPYDGDDWANLSGFRAAVPKVGAWNPIKILPEDSFPIIGYVAAYFIMPFTKDYIFSIALASAILVSGIICCYVFLFSKILERKFHLKSYEIYALTFAFFLLHFLIFRSSETGSQYLFGSANLTCFYHYNIPGLLSLCLVEYFLAYGLPKRLPLEKGMGYCALLIFVIYLAIFSNVLENMSLAAFLFVYVLFTYKGKLFKPSNWKSICMENSFLLAIMVVWLISLGFEMTGGRAHSIGASFLQLPLKRTIMAAWSTLKGTNKIFLLLLASSLGFSAFCWLRGKWNEETEKLGRIVGLLLLSSVFSFIYLVLVCAKASAGYIASAHVMLGACGLLIMAAVCTAALFLKKYPKAFLLAPILLLVIAVDVMKGGYAESTMGRVLPSACYLVDHDLVNQVVQADKAHQKKMVLHVPKGDNRDNWPHPMYMGKSFSRTLCHHGIITAPIEITIQPDVSMNEKYNLPIRK